MDDNRSDLELIKAARTGDRAAFGGLVGRHRSKLVGLCRRMLGDVGLAEDAAQEAALQAMLSLDKLRQPEQFGAWLSGIGLNICRWWLRMGKRESWSWEDLYGGSVVGEEPGETDDPAAAAEEAELVQSVRAAVAALPPGQRAAVMLFYLSGLTHAETAAALGIGTGAVKTRLHNARENLKRSLCDTWKEFAMTNQDADGFVDVRLADVLRYPAFDDTPPRHVIVLEEIDSSRRLPIWIGKVEAEMMVLHLTHFQFPRPFPYQLAVSVLQSAGGRIREVQVSKIEQSTFFALVVVEGTNGIQSVDARASDAVNLALVAGVPIKVAASVFDACAVDRQAQPDSQSAIYDERPMNASALAAELSANWHSR